MKDVIGEILNEYNVPWQGKTPAEVRALALELPDEAKERIRVASLEEISEAEDDLWAWVDMYQKEISHHLGEGKERPQIFYGLWNELADQEAEQPSDPDRLLRLLHTAIFSLAIAQDENARAFDGNRRQGR